MIPVFYSPKQVVDADLGASPSARKPPLVLESWRAARFSFEVLEPSPVTAEDLSRAHAPDFVQDILTCRRSNGFGNRLAAVANSLPWTSGSMLSAARHLVRTGGPVAVSPTSGFHHASFRKAEGFCTFNGLMVTLLALRADGVTGRIGILDLDEHFGNGTDDIIRRLGVAEVEHYTFGGEQSVRRGDGEAWLNRLPNIVRTFQGCTVVLYQAGADPHEHDPYSRGVLSTEQLYRRDQVVFRGLAGMGVPVVWNLAGGYQEPLRKVLDIHDNTMRACVESYGGGRSA